MDLPKTNIHRNGDRASPETGGAFDVGAKQSQGKKENVERERIGLGVKHSIEQQQALAQERVQRVRAKQTVFQVDTLGHSPRTLLYNLSRHTFGEIVLSRWLSLLLLLLGIGWFVGNFPLRWIVPLLSLLTIITLATAIRYWRKRDFVRFRETSPPAVDPEILPPEEKIPIHATGYLSVEGRGQRYSWVPGFYRTFATREHAILCMVPNRKYLGIGRWPYDEVGMWYAFFFASEIVQIRWGELSFDNRPRPALAIEHRVTVPARNRIKREKIVTETLYITCQQEEQAKRIWADLQYQ